ncbi:MAG: hypothetical protein VKM92_07445 [Cyanobacteriota bacterium]|nr:hypothetical protein [Cyanobacteriota bacterium]
MASTKLGSISFTDPLTGTTTNVMVYAMEIDGVVEFTLTVEGNDPAISAGDLLGFFIDFEGTDKEPTTTLSVEGDALEIRQGDDDILWVGTKANNMNGTAANAEEGAIANDGYDVGVQLTTSGASGGNSDSLTFSISGITLEDLYGQRFGIRLQNTLNAEGSLKLEGTFDQPEPIVFNGLSHGYWKNHGPGSELKPGEGLFNDWDNTSRDPVIGSSKPVYTGALGSEAAVSFETFFGVDTTWNFPGKVTRDDITLLEALGLTGGDLHALAREATAAVLNSRDENIQYYKFTEAQIIQWTQQVFSGGVPDTDGLNGDDWANNAEAITGLKTLFEIQNTLDLQTAL